MYLFVYIYIHIHTYPLHGTAATVKQAPALAYKLVRMTCHHANSIMLEITSLRADKPHKSFRSS